MRRSRAIIMGVAAGIAVIAVPPVLVGDRSAKGRIPTYDVVLTVRIDGSVHVRETLTFDFKDRQRQGLVRELPYRRGDRLFQISGVRAVSTTGAPAATEVSTFRHRRQIKIGKGRTVEGRQAYVLDYDLDGVIVLKGGKAELLWDALGAGWGVPIGEAAVRVEGPVRFASGCLAGSPAASTRCARASRGPTAVEFLQSGLRPHECIKIRAAFPAGAVRVPPPRLARPHLAFGRSGLLTLGIITPLALLLAAARARLPHRARSGGAGGDKARVWTARGLLAVGAATAGWDLVAEMVRDGFWHAAVGDPLLVGIALAVLGYSLGLSREIGAAGSAGPSSKDSASGAA